jgi:hypothetical protein
MGGNSFSKTEDKINYTRKQQKSEGLQNYHLSENDLYASEFSLEYQRPLPLELSSLLLALSASVWLLYSLTPRNKISTTTIKLVNQSRIVGFKIVHTRGTAAQGNEST